MIPSYMLDIETVAYPEAEIRAMLPPFDENAVEIPSNYKNQDAKDGFVEKARANYGNEIIKKAAVHPEYSQCAIIGLMEVTRDGNAGAVTQLAEDDEKHMLETAWGMLKLEHSSAQVYGWNLKNFDLWYMVRRSWLHGVHVPKPIFDLFNPRHPWSRSVVDLQECYAGGDFGKKYTSLDSALRFLRLPPKTGSGAGFGTLWEKDRAGALRYNADDLKLEHMVAVRIGAIQQAPKDTMP